VIWKEVFTKMKPVSIKYVFVESFNNIIRNRVLFITSVFTVCVTILLMGVVGVLLMNVSYNSDNILDDMLHITVYVIPEADVATLNEIQDYIVADPNVEQITYISQEEAFESGKELVGEDIMNELGSSFLPASFVVKLNDVTYSNIFVQKMKALSNIYEVKYSSEAYERAAGISYTIRYVSAVLTTLLGILSLFLISNTIKITLSTSKDEVAIMRYIGASESRIKSPFYLQGGAIGFLGAIISFLISGFGYNYLYNKLEGGLDEYIGKLELVPVSQMLLVLLGVFLAYGTILGVTGSFFAIRKYLKV